MKVTLKRELPPSIERKKELLKLVGFTYYTVSSIWYHPTFGQLNFTEAWEIFEEYYDYELDDNDHTPGV